MNKKRKPVKASVKKISAKKTGAKKPGKKTGAKKPKGRSAPRKTMVRKFKPKAVPQKPSARKPARRPAPAPVLKPDAALEPLVECAVRAAFAKKALNVKVMDLRPVTSMADFFVLCSGESAAQIQAIKESVIQGATAIGETPWHTEGHDESRWVLVDFVNVVVHIFDDTTRAYYGLEKLWGDAVIRECKPEDFE